MKTLIKINLLKLSFILYLQKFNFLLIIQLSRSNILKSSTDSLSNENIPSNQITLAKFSSI